MNYQYLSKSRISWLTWTNQNLNVSADHAPSHCYKYQTPLLGKFIVHEVSFLVVLLQKVSIFSLLQLSTTVTTTTTCYHHFSFLVDSKSTLIDFSLFLITSVFLIRFSLFLINHLI